MSRRLFWAVRLVALLGIAGGLSGCAVYATPGYAYRSPGYGYGYGYGGPPLRPYYRPYYGYGGGSYGRGYGGYGRPYW
jgi:hypothetical protein